MDARSVVRKIVHGEQPVLGLVAAFCLGYVLELTGQYLLMLVAGGVAGMLVKKGWASFLVGFTGVAAAWGVFFLQLALHTPFATFLELIGHVLGAPGWLLVVMALCIGGLLGGTGGLVGAFSIQAIQAIQAGEGATSSENQPG